MWHIAYHGCWDWVGLLGLGCRAWSHTAPGFKSWLSCLPTIHTWWFTLGASLCSSVKWGRKDLPYRIMWELNGNMTVKPFAQCLCISQGSQEKQNRQNGYRDRDSVIVRNWLRWWRRLASPKSAGWACKLEALGSADGVQGQRCLLAEFHLGKEWSVWGLVRPSADWRRPPIVQRVLYFSHWLRC